VEGAKAVRIVAVGQTPPPFGGQSIAIQSFVTGRYEGLEIFHLRMAFSQDMDAVGKPRPRKLLHLLTLVARILWCRARTGAKVLYYPPAGPDLVPILRDLAVLLATRWAFDTTVFHFHAGGLSEAWPRLPRPLRPLFRAAYRRPDLAIQPSDLNPPDGRFLDARRTVVVPGGVPDLGAGKLERPARRNGPPVILYIGVLRESKGVLVLVEACRLLRASGVDFRLDIVGAFESERFATELRGALAGAGLAEVTTLLGNRTADEKAACYRASDVFCYPTYFESETFGLVLAEAMQFSLPVVATRWRGVPSVVADGESGLLVPVRDPAALADALQRVIEDPELARRLGRRGREIYLQRFTEENYRRAMADALRAL
jgi:glycosyltransferase involved in cell wall biosynthesis